MMDATLRLGTKPHDCMVIASEHGLLVVAGWTVGIPVEDALRYARGGLTKNPHEGFFYDEGSGKTVILSHKGAKIAFSLNEAEGIIGHIIDHYGGQHRNSA